MSKRSKFREAVHVFVFRPLSGKQKDYPLCVLRASAVNHEQNQGPAQKEDDCNLSAYATIPHPVVQSAAPGKNE